MAPTQVEIASTSSLFGVLKDHSPRDAYTTHETLKKNIKSFVKDHLNPCNNVSISSDSLPNQNTQKPITKADSWVSKVANNNLGILSFKRNHDKDDSSLSAQVSPRHTKISTDQSAEMVSKHGMNKAEEMKNLQSRSFSFNSRRDNMSMSMSPHSDGDSSECPISKIGASSLVQLWERRLNHSKGTKPSLQASHGRTSFNGRCINRMAFSEEDPCDDECPSWESSSLSWGACEKSGASVVQSSSPKVHSLLDAAERESGRVADIIKRLTSINQMPSSVSVSDVNDQEMCHSVTGSPYRERDPGVIHSSRIRGRQAFKDLLMQLEKDRHGELNYLAGRGAVSKFTQRGRIEALLRLKLLQRGVAACDQSREKSTAAEVNRQPQGSVITQLRERFSTGVEHRTSALAEESNTRPRREIENSINNSPITQQLSKDSGCSTAYGTAIHSAKTTQNSVLLTSVDNNYKEEAHSSSEVTVKGPCFEAPKETNEANENSYDEIVEGASYQQYDESSYFGIEEEDQNYDGVSCYDWMSPISRPRSYWEERRQEWYREMLHFSSNKEEIRNLLERRTVSSSLSSPFRDRIDNLVKSQVVAQAQLVRSIDNEEDNDIYMDQLMAFFHDRLNSGADSTEEGGDGAVEEEEKRRNVDEGEEEKAEESISGGSDHELNDYFVQSSSLSSNASSQSLLRTWIYEDNEARDDSDRVTTTSSPTTLQPQSFFHGFQHSSSSTSHPSIEMEFLYDLRGQIDHLFQEMSELRKTFQSCMDMQMQFQQSKNQVVHKVKKEEKIHNRAPRKGNCRMCNDKKVNSVLYRCGHMCVCFKCANELQRNDGKCPICRASIIDVVLVYADT